MNKQDLKENIYVLGCIIRDADRMDLDNESDEIVGVLDFAVQGGLAKIQHALNTNLVTDDEFNTMLMEYIGRGAEGSRGFEDDFWAMNPKLDSEECALVMTKIELLLSDAKKDKPMHYNIILNHLENEAWNTSIIRKAKKKVMRKKKAKVKRKIAKASRRKGRK